MKIKFVLSILCITILLSFKSVKVGNKDFKIISAQSQTIYGGAAGSPVMTRYTIQLKALRSFTLMADSAYAEGKITSFQILTATNKVDSIKKIKRGKMLTIVFTIITPGEMGGSDLPQKFYGSPLAKPPISCVNGVVVRYKKGKMQYLAIEKMKTIEPELAP